MNLTEKQVLLLLKITTESLKVSDKTGIFSINKKDRVQIINNIIEQQGNNLVNIQNDNYPVKTPPKYSNSSL